MSRRLIPLLLTGLLGACSQHIGKPAQPPPAPLHTKYTVTADVVYSAPEWPQRLLADIYRPEGAGPFPSVLLIHGGSWKSGDRAQVKSLARRIAARGYLVVNVTYRLVPQYLWPTQLQDMQQALRWMRSPQGREYGIDPARIGTFGYSAGAHLAALVAGVGDDRSLGGDADTRVRAVVAGGTPADLPRFKNGKLVPAFIGEPWEKNQAAWIAASPVTYASRPGHPPVFLYHAGMDKLVPIEQAEVYKAALDEAGVTNEFFIIRGHGHISGFIFDGAAVNAALEFLDRHLR